MRETWRANDTMKKKSNGETKTRVKRASRRKSTVRPCYNDIRGRKQAVSKPYIVYTSLITYLFVLMMGGLLIPRNSVKAKKLEILRTPIHMAIFHFVKRFHCNRYGRVLPRRRELD